MRWYRTLLLIRLCINEVTIQSSIKSRKRVLRSITCTCSAILLSVCNMHIYIYIYVYMYIYIYIDMKWCVCSCINEYVYILSASEPCSSDYEIKLSYQINSSISSLLSKSESSSHATTNCVISVQSNDSNLYMCPQPHTHNTVTHWHVICWHVTWRFPQTENSCHERS